MTTLINRLRETASKGVSVWGDLQMEAADRIEELEAENARLRKALEEAADDIESWGSYAAEYYQKKWNLQGCIDAARKALETT